MPARGSESASRYKRARIGRGVAAVGSTVPAPSDVEGVTASSRSISCKALSGRVASLAASPAASRDRNEAARTYRGAVIIVRGPAARYFYPGNIDGGFY